MAYIGEIRLFALPFVPSGWLPCDGSVYVTIEYPELAKFLSNTYGGNGATTFAVPDLRGRVPIGVGKDSFGIVYTLGQAGGADEVALTIQQIPTHHHAMVFDSAPGTALPAAGNFPAGAGPDTQQTPITPNLYNPNVASPSQIVALADESIKQAGAGLPHNNVQPSITLAYCIACDGDAPY
jgi:microcystin-dependent protein